MIIGKKKTVQSVALTENIDEVILGTAVESEYIANERRLLRDIYKAFKSKDIELENKDFVCYVERSALLAFLKFANEVYKTRRHEAQGVFVGYYFHNPNNDSKKFIVATNFLQASGNTSFATCEMSTQDLNKYGDYCDKHKQLIVAHIHSHPGFGAFYSMPDSETLRTLFYADHNIGIVVDNLQNEFLGFKMYGNEKREEPIYLFDIEDSIIGGHLNSCMLSNVSGSSNFKVHEVVDYSSLKPKNVIPREAIRHKERDSSQQFLSQGNHIDLNHTEDFVDAQSLDKTRAYNNDTSQGENHLHSQKKKEKRMVERTDIENLEGRLLKEFEKVHEEIVKENNTTQSENNTLAVWINPQFTKKYGWVIPLLIFLDFLISIICLIKIISISSIPE